MAKVSIFRSASHSLSSWLLPSLLLALVPNGSVGFSASTPSVSSLFDRFVPSCPADKETVRKFDSSLVGDVGIWVAVHRSFNNKPSVLIRDEFFNAMRSATDVVVNQVSHQQGSYGSDKRQDGSFVNKQSSSSFESNSSSSPVAVARLYQPENANHFLLDSIRCVLKKEETDHSCDGSSSGASEHTEALCVAIDALLERYLESNDHFEGVIRTKATLVAAPLLESRGFVPVQTLSSDMATHVSSLDQCLSSYADRAVATSKSPGARQRAINIVSRLGRIDRDRDLKEKRRREQQVMDESNDDYDPWQSVRRYI